MIFLIILLLEKNLQAGCWSLKTASPADPQKGGVEWHPMALVVCVERIEQIKGQTRRFQPRHGIDEVTQWSGPLEAMHPIDYFDALRLKIRDECIVKNKAVYLPLGVRADGRKEVLGMWMSTLRAPSSG
jgi:hypothetical protein